MVRPTFLGLEIAKSGLFVAQRNLDVTSHNIANADTAGFTRQRLVSEAVYPPYYDTRFLQAPDGKVGLGVRVAKIEQIRDAFLDRQIRDQNTKTGQAAVMAAGLSDLEPLFDERSASGLSQSISDFFDAMYKLSNGNVSDMALRTNVQQQAMKMTETFNYFSERLVDYQKTTNDLVATSVDEINAIAEQLADLNAKIYSFEIGGDSANDLKDSRNQLLDRLSALVDVSYSTNAQGQMVVQTGGHDLVNYNKVSKLAVVADTTADPNTGLYKNTVYWCNPTTGLPNTGSPLTVNGGELGGHLAVRDGTTAQNPGIGYFLNKINDLARAVVTEVNKVHQTGWTYSDANPSTSVTGTNMFIMTNAGDMQLHPDIIADVKKIAASSVQVMMNADSPQQGNNQIALKLADIINQKGLAVIGNIDDFINGMVVEFATALQKANNLAANLGSIGQSLIDKRESISGVNLDEELTNMVRFLHTYNANARMISTIDESLDKLINGTGLVGRG